jgi:hypothetical protein
VLARPTATNVRSVLGSLGLASHAKMPGIYTMEHAWILVPWALRPKARVTFIASVFELAFRVFC